MSERESSRSLGEPGEHPLSVLLFSWMRTRLFAQGVHVGAGRDRRLR